METREREAGYGADAVHSVPRTPSQNWRYPSQPRLLLTDSGWEEPKLVGPVTLGPGSNARTARVVKVNGSFVSFALWLANSLHHVSDAGSRAGQSRQSESEPVTWLAELCLAVLVICRLAVFAREESLLPSQSRVLRTRQVGTSLRHRKTSCFAKDTARIAPLGRKLRTTSPSGVPLGRAGPKR